jgi:hypothetical protein
VRLLNTLKIVHKQLAESVQGPGLQKVHHQSQMDVLGRAHLSTRISHFLKSPVPRKREGVHGHFLKDVCLGRVQSRIIGESELVV